MRLKIAMIIAITLLFVFVSCAQNEKTISMTGVASVPVEFDTVSMDISYLSIQDTAAGAKEDCNRVMSDAFQTLLSLGIKEDEIEKSRLSVSPIKSWNSELDLYIDTRGQKAYQSLTIARANTGETLSIFSEITDELSLAERITVSGLSFSSDNYDEYFAQALRLAFQDARLKAEALAGEASLEILEVDSIDYNDSTFSMPHTFYPEGPPGFEGRFAPEYMDLTRSIYYNSKDTLIASVNARFRVK